MSKIIAKKRGVSKQDGFIFNVVNGEVYANSNEIAKQFGKRHDDVIKKIDNEIERFHSAKLRNAIDDFFRVSDYINSNNRSFRRYDLTFKGFQQIVLSYTGDKAFENRVNFINAFETLLKTVHDNQLQAQLNLKSDVWLDIRTEAKLERTKFTDALSEVFMPQRVKEGKETDQFLSRYIKNFTDNIIYKKLGIKTTIGVKVNRDIFTATQIVKVGIIEEQISELIYKYQDEYYKDIYKIIKAELLSQ